MTIIPWSKTITKPLAISIFRSSSFAPIILMIFLGLFTKPSSSALIDKWKYRHWLLSGISKNKSLSTIFSENILLSAILSYLSSNKKKTIVFTSTVLRTFIMFLKFILVRFQFLLWLVMLPLNFQELSFVDDILKFQ